MTSHRWFRLPANLRSAGAVVILGVFVALVTLTGRASGLRPSADAHATRPATVSSTSSTTTLHDVVSALMALGAPSSSAHAASRSLRRTPITHAVPAHRWVRPYYGVFSSPFGYRW